MRAYDDPYYSSGDPAKVNPKFFFDVGLAEIDEGEQARLRAKRRQQESQAVGRSEVGSDSRGGSSGMVSSSGPGGKGGKKGGYAPPLGCWSRGGLPP